MDYEREYNDLIARINAAKEKPSLCMKDKHHYNGYVETGIRDALDYIVSPESEDERIRKALIHLISEQDGFLTAINGISVKDVLAYLERQKRQTAKTDACGFPIRDEGESACSYLERCLAPDMRNIWYEACAEIKEKQAEQKPAEYIKRNSKEWYALLSEQWDRGFWKGKEEQKPAEWSEEDEEMFASIIADIKFTQRAHNHEVDQVVYEREIDWLKSLRPKPRWKPSEQ